MSTQSKFWYWAPACALAHRINYIKPRISIRKSLARVNKCFNLNCTANAADWHSYSDYYYVQLGNMLGSFNIQQRIYIFCADMSRLKVITFEQSKHYVLYVIGFYMNYTDWVGVEDTEPSAGQINNSVWSHNKYDTSQKFYCRWYLHSSSVVFHDLCLLGNTIFA